MHPVSTVKYFPIFIITNLTLKVITLENSTSVTFVLYLQAYSRFSFTSHGNVVRHLNTCYKFNAFLIR
jgi:hypothetical protein